MAKTKFKIGDRVKIKWPGNRSDGKIGTIVKDCCDTIWTVKIPNFKGHAGGIFDGTENKWSVSEEKLIKLPEETKSMKIEVKQTKKTEKKSKETVYPCFKKSNNGNELIVLFFSEFKGLVVDPGTQTYWNVGRYFDRWGDFSKDPLENYSATISSNP